jgi:hypothetical protein
MSSEQHQRFLRSEKSEHMDTVAVQIFRVQGIVWGIGIAPPDAGGTILRLSGGH